MSQSHSSYFSIEYLYFFAPHIFGLHSQRTHVHMTENRAAISIVGSHVITKRDNIALLISGIRGRTGRGLGIRSCSGRRRQPGWHCRCCTQCCSRISIDPSVERPRKLGLGSAVAAGFAIAKGDYWVMMDADLSHRPQDLPILLEALANADIVVGSRYISGGATQGWPFTASAHESRSRDAGPTALGLDIRDATSGFAAFRRETVERCCHRCNRKGSSLLLRNSGQSDPGPRD